MVSQSLTNVGYITPKAASMSAPPVSQVFEPGLVKPRMHLEALIHEYILTTAQEMSVGLGSRADVVLEGPVGALNELGDYFTRTAAFWSALTEKLVAGEGIRSIIHRDVTEAHEASANKSNMADLTVITEIDLKSSRLRKMRELSRSYWQNMEAIWHPGPPVESLPYFASPAAASDDFKRQPLLSASLKMEADPTGLDGRRIKRESSQQPTSPPSGRMSGSEESSDEDEQFSASDMEALKQRGKGSYVCPKGYRCDKGGVDTAGNLVTFDRNSSFAQHCNKHRKPWRCDLPGCPNPPKKRKFARRDGLERHKQTVKHHVSN